MREFGLVTPWDALWGQYDSASLGQWNESMPSMHTLRLWGRAALTGQEGKAASVPLNLQMRCSPQARSTIACLLLINDPLAAAAAGMCVWG